MSKNTLLFVILLFVLAFVTRTFSAPYAQNNNLYMYQYQASPPSWYVSSVSQGTLYTYAYPSSLSITVRRYTTAYSFATANYWLSISLGNIYNGASYDGDNYELRYSYSYTASSSSLIGVTYTISSNIFKYYIDSSATVSFYFKAPVSGASAISNYTIIFYNNGNMVYRYSASSGSITSWTQVSYNAPSGNNTLSVYVYVIYNLNQGNTFTFTLEIDKITVTNSYLVNWYDASYTLTPAASASGTQTIVTVTITDSAVNYSKPVSLSPSPASYSYTSSQGILTVTAYYNAQSQSLATGTFTLPKPSGYSVLQYIARAPQGYYIVTNSSAQEYFDEAYVPGSATALQVSFVQPSWKAVYTLAQRYVFSVLNSSGISIGSVLLPAGKYLVLVSRGDTANICYLKLNSTIMYSASLLNNTVLSPPQSGTITVTFTVQDYGANYQLLQASDLQGRIVGSSLIGSTGQVAMNLTPYASYMITVCKTGLCKSIGLVTISSSNIQLSVMPTVPTVSQPSLASATYDYTNKALRVNVSCAAPPCSVNIYKSVTWYNYWQMRLPVSLSQGWNLVFLEKINTKSNTVSASGMWAYINNTDWSEVRFGDASGLPENFLNYSIIWSNTTHAQVLVYAPQSGTYYLYWQPMEQVPYVNVSNPFVQCISGRCGVYFDGVGRYGVAPLPSQLTGNPTFTLSLWSYQYLPPDHRSWELLFGYPNPLQAFHIILTSGSSHASGFWGASGVNTGVTYGIAPQSWENYVIRYDSSSMYLEAYRNNALAGSITFQITNTQWGTQPNIPSTGSFYIAKAFDYYFFQGYIGSVIVYNRYVSTSEISQLYQNPDSPPTSGIILWFKADPHYIYDKDWNGYVDWIDLSGNNNYATLYGFHTQGSFINAPQRQPYSMLVITQTCNAQLCSYSVNSGDPYFTVIVNDANGEMSQANTGMSVPLWQSPLGSVVTTIGKTLNLDAWGVNINDLFIFLIGLAILYSAFTYRNWELGLIVFGVWLSIGTLLLGGSGRLMVPGLSLALFGAAISYMLKREQAP